MKPVWFLFLSLTPLGCLLAQSSAPTTSEFAPLDYFDAHCARCHGPNGSFYGDNFGKNLKDDAALRQVVKQMCEGPGDAPLDDKNLEVLTDFHRALRDNKPYVVAVSFKEGVLSGEASPESKLTLENGSQKLDGPLEGHSWKILLAPDFDFSQAQLRAVSPKGVETVISLKH